MKRRPVRPLPVAALALRAMAILAMLAAAFATLPSAARAECGTAQDVPVMIDPGGVRAALSHLGIQVGGIYYGETFANAGGFNQGSTYFGVLDLYLDADMHKLGLWKGLCFHTNGFQIHGQSITADDVGSLNPVSGLEATPSTRMEELWLEQHLFNGKLAVRFGQLAGETEFALSDGGNFFLNSAWEWLASIAYDLPSGGPAYPFAAPGVRVAVTPNDKFQFLAVVYNGDPAPPCASEDPQICNNDGLDFELDDPPLVMAEGAYKHSQAGLAGQVKLGGWYHFGEFADQRFDKGGNLIAVTGLPGKSHDHNWGLYGIFDQLIWRVPGSEKPKGIALFGNVISANPSDRNLVNLYAELGITFSGMIPRRPDDVLGVGIAYTGISDQVHAFDIDSGLPVARSYEAILEVCYTMQLAKGWMLQPDFQYIWQPGGNVPNPDGSGAVESATVVGVRTTLNF